MLDENKYQSIDTLIFEEQPIKKFQNKPMMAIVILGLVAIFMLFTAAWVLGALILGACIFTLFYIPNKKIMDVYQDKVVIYHKNDDNLVEVINFDDVAQWRVQSAKPTGSMVIFMMNNGDVAHAEMMESDGAFKVLNKLIPEKETSNQRLAEMNELKTPFSKFKRKKH